jgi:hypothetical protein
MDDGIGHAQPARGGHLLDSVRMEVGGQEPLQAGDVVPAQDVVDDPEQLVVAVIEKKPTPEGFPIHTDAP